MHVNSGDDVATSCENLVNFCLATPEIMELICVPRYLYLAKIDLHICIRRAAIQKCHGAVYLRLLGGSTVMFCYYLLAGDTVVPSGLYTRLCHAFLVLNYNDKQISAIYSCFL